MSIFERWGKPKEQKEQGLPSKEELEKRSAESGPKSDAFKIDDPASGMETVPKVSNADIIQQTERKSGPADGELKMEPIYGLPEDEPSGYTNADIVHGRHPSEAPANPAGEMEGVDAPELLESLAAERGNEGDDQNKQVA